MPAPQGVHRRAPGAACTRGGRTLQRSAESAERSASRRPARSPEPAAYEPAVQPPIASACTGSDRLVLLVGIGRARVAQRPRTPAEVGRQQDTTSSTPTRPATCPLYARMTCATASPTGALRPDPPRRLPAPPRPPITALHRPLHQPTRAHRRQLHREPVVTASHSKLANPTPRGLPFWRWFCTGWTCYPDQQNTLCLRSLRKQASRHGRELIPRLGTPVGLCAANCLIVSSRCSRWEVGWGAAGATVRRARVPPRHRTHDHQLSPMSNTSHVDLDRRRFPPC